MIVSVDVDMNFRQRSSKTAHPLSYYFVYKAGTIWHYFKLCIVESWVLTVNVNLITEIASKLDMSGFDQM